jgi:DNA-directed RNA polymerase subunit RPC12/RpoP
MNDFIVSTECPTCSAPLDFSEGTNAVQCGHCSSKLLVTGRKQVLSYFIRPKVDHYRAIAAAMKAHQERGNECKVIRPQIYFIPYYRLTGNDFRWEEAPRVQLKPDIEYGQTGGYGGDYEWEYEDNKIDFGTIFRHAEDLIDIIFGGKCGPGGPIGNAHKETIPNTLAAGGSDNEGPAKVQIADRYVEKNFVACDLHGEGLYSLGLRPAVLRLELFQKGELESLGKIVNPDLGINEAMGSGMKEVSMQPLLFRSVLGRILSIIYFPFWVIEMERGEERIAAIVDGVSQSVAKPDAATSIYSVLNKPPRSESQTVGFRPLACPNCGWDLPLRPDDVIFFCSSCSRAWQIYGSELTEVPYQTVQVDDMEGHLKYLPFWVLIAKAGAEASTFYIPAFRFRRLKMLADLAANITRKKPDYAVCSDEKQEPKEMQGCFYDTEDAFLLAQFVQAGIKSQNADEMKKFNKDDLILQGATLTWIPFKVNGCSLVDPFTGTSIPQGLLI